MIINGYYGSGNTPCEIFVYENWYVIDGSVNVNQAPDDTLHDGINVETIQDVDMFTASKPIESEEELEEEVNA